MPETQQFGVVFEASAEVIPGDPPETEPEPEEDEDESE